MRKYNEVTVENSPHTTCDECAITLEDTAIEVFDDRCDGLIGVACSEDCAEVIGVMNEDDLLEKVDNWLNENYDTVEILGSEYLPSEILKELDPDAYHVFCFDIANELLDEDGIIIEGYTTWD